MELSLLFTLFFLASLMMIILLTLISSTRKFPENRQLPPGNTGLPYIGETLDFSIMGKQGIPEKFFMERMKNYSQHVFKTSLIGQKTAVFCGVSGNKFLFSNENKLVALSWPSNVKKIFPFSGNTAEEISSSSMRFRRNLHAVLTPESLQTYVGMVDMVSNEHLKNNWNVEKDGINVLTLAKQFSFTVSCKLFLDIDDGCNNFNDLAGQFEDVVSGIFSIPIEFPGSAFSRGIKASNSIRKELVEIIRQRKNDLKHSSVDFLSSLLKSTDEDGKMMTELEIADQLLASLIGSRDSNTSAITSIIKYLAEYPLVYDEVLKEQRSIAEAKPEGELLNWKDIQKMKYSWNMVCEVLRLVPPMQGNFREALSDFSFANFFIPKGWKLYWSPNTTHKNPKYFPEPEKFDPSRFEKKSLIPTYAFVPFGGGPRICPGKDVAKLVLLAFVYNVVGKFRWEMLCPDERFVILAFPVPEKGLPIRLFRNI